jgi:hypothetical protein
MIFIFETRTAGLELGNTVRLSVASTISAATLETAKDTNYIIDIRYLHLIPIRMFGRAFKVSQPVYICERKFARFLFPPLRSRVCTVDEQMIMLCVGIGVMH